MNAAFIICSIGFFLWILRNTLFWVELWQTKEYKFKRVVSYLLQTKQGHNLLFSPFNLIKIALLVVFPFSILYPPILIFSQLIISAFFTVSGLLVIKEYLGGDIKIPQLGPKALIIILISILFTSVLYEIPFADAYYWLLVLDKFLLFVILFIVFLLYFPTSLYIDWYVDKAVKKIKSEQNLLVVAVTGSYGKSSTKDFAAQILQNKFTVAKTSSMQNTVLGIAKAVASKINSRTNIFLAEMAIYTPGEIAEICQMIHPKIGIITGISKQHSGLTGNVDSKKESNELISSIPKNGLLLFNGNNKTAKKIYGETRKKKALYAQVLKDKQIKADISAKNIIVEKTGLSFDVVLNRQTLHLKTSIIGQHNVENILPGIYLAKYLGYTSEHIKKAVAHLTPLSRTMQKIEAQNGIIFIDDTFTTTPASIRAALSYLNLYKKQKILVLEPILDLGKSSFEEHFLLAKEIAKTCDYLLLTNKNYYKAIQKGVSESNSSCSVRHGNKKQLASYIQEIVNRGDIVIFEGNESFAVLKELI